MNTASADTINYVHSVILREINSATDNPLIFMTGEGNDIHFETLSGGNFHGQPVALALDFLAMAVKFGFTLHDLATMENVYSPAIGALNEPIVLAAQNGLDQLQRT